MNTHVIVSDTRRGVFDMHRGFSELCREVSHIRRDVLEIKGRNEEQFRLVGATVLC